jgi:hypothetical protein
LRRRETGWSDSLKKCFSYKKKTENAGNAGFSSFSLAEDGATQKFDREVYDTQSIDT